MISSPLLERSIAGSSWIKAGVREQLLIAE
jgi:hypothetical protein